jgi:hypothetical protein
MTPKNQTAKARLSLKGVAANYQTNTSSKDQNIIPSTIPNKVGLKVSPAMTATKVKSTHNTSQLKYATAGTNSCGYDHLSKQGANRPANGIKNIKTTTLNIGVIPKA